MTVRLFQRTRFRGHSAFIRRDKEDLADIHLGRNPSSLTMSEHDAVLLFTRAGWMGGVMFHRGHNHIENLRSRRAGGRAGFGRSITSVRITPFVVRFNATVVTRSDGTLPGGFTGSADIDAYLEAMITELNAWYDRERVLLRAGIARVIRRDDDAKVDLTVAEATAGFPSAWTSSREIDLIIVNSFDSAAMADHARAPGWGKVAITALRSGGPGGSPIHPACLATNVAREVGHFLGSAHRPAAGANIMTRGLDPIAARRASVDQIQQWHRTLARNPDRRHNRLDS